MNNIYSEMLSSLPVPERLSPENIALMLEENSAAKKKRAMISSDLGAESRRELPKSKKTVTVTRPSEIYTQDAGKETSAEPEESTAGTKIKEISVSGEKAVSTREEKTAAGRSGRRTAYYRAVLSIAACAALVFGMTRYFDNGEVAQIDTEIKGSTYASDYDELHKTFRKYYVDDEEKQTLDSAMAQIEHSYDESQGSGVSDNVTEPSQTTPEDAVTGEVTEPQEDTTGENTAPTAPDETETQPQTPDENVSIEEVDPADTPLPEFTGEALDNAIISGNRIYVIDGNTVKVILTDNGQMSYIGDITPSCDVFETKTLERVIPMGDRVAMIYSSVNEEPETIPVFEDSGTLVDEIFDIFYTEEQASSQVRSVEVAIYDIYQNGVILPLSVLSQNGTLVDVRSDGEYIYLVTDYDDYRNSPLTGVDDLDSYVPSYEQDGVKYYIQPENILIPGYVSTTDYTIVSGMSIGAFGVTTDVQAVLGSEGKVIVTDSAVYIYGYSGGDGVDETVCEKLRLSYGTARYENSYAVEGVALAGGIYECDGTIFVTTLKKSDTDYTTVVYAFDSEMNMLSRVEFPAALSKVSFNGKKVYLTSGAKSYGADFSQPANPQLIDYKDQAEIDLTSDLMEFGNGYVTLTRGEDGSIVLSKIVSADGGYITEAFTTVASPTGDPTSMALGDNSVMYLDPYSGYVGVPYGFFDGYDYCYRYALYRLTGAGFELVGQIESHEVDEAFEMGRSELSGGILYIFSEGRIYSATAGGSLSVISSAELIESSYSGHSSW